MNLLFIFMFISMIVAPFVYFLYLFHHLSKFPKIVVAVLSCLSLIVILIKLFLHPYSSLFFTITIIIQFYIVTVFITLLLTALYQLTARLLHKQMTRKVMIIFGVIGLLFTSVGYATHFHKNVTSYQVTIDKESSLDQLHIAFISDIHLGSGTYLSDLTQLVKDINQKQYDLICFGGDLFDESTPVDMVEESLKILSQMKSTYGSYAVNGNHEHYANILNEELYKKYNIYHLSENYVCVDDLFNIVGREDVAAHIDNQMSNLLQGMDETLPTIVLDHNPKRYQDIIKDGDLQLSGHTHAGQAFPLTLITSAMYDNSYGKLEKNSFSLIVSSGYGSWGFPIRFLTKCEYVDIEVTFTKK